MIRRATVIGASASVAIAVILVVYFAAASKEIGSTEISRNSAGNNSKFVVACNCVVFTLDDVQDYWLQSSQLAIMDLFLSRNQQLSVGLIMGHIGNDQALVDKVRNGASKGLFETAIEGWHYVNYSKLSESEQESSLQEANNKMQLLLGNKSQIFIPPMGLINPDTLKAMDRTDVRILSDIPHTYQSELWKRNYLVSIENNSVANDQTKEIIYLPHSASFKDYANGKQYSKSINATLGEIEKNVGTFGYAVVLIHPQDVARQNIQANSFEDRVDIASLDDLASLIERVNSKGIKIASFSELASEVVDTAKSKGIPILPELSKIEEVVPSGNVSLTLLPAEQRFNESNMSPPDAISVNESDQYHTLMASIYNNYGKYIYERSLEKGVSPSSIAGILFVESHGLAFGEDGRMTIRFEACTFFDLWGRAHPKEFADHFQCDLPNDRFRFSSAESFAVYHDNPNREWMVFEFARTFDEDAAIRSISMGLGQIMGFHNDKIGYGSPKQMFDAMSKSAKSQIDGLFLGLQYTNGDRGTCLDKLRLEEYVGFAACYNSVGRDITYADQLVQAINDYKDFTRNRLYSDSVSQG